MAGNQWPGVEGRYRTGNPGSPVAVCTMASMDLIESIPSDKVAIVGKAVTENLGVEKIVRNIVANPKIRFLILCGQVSKGHFVGQAIKSLIENGVDGDGRIIGAKGAMPVLKNVSRDEIELFRKQVEPVDLIGEVSVERIMEKIEECVKNNPGPFDGGTKVKADAEKPDGKEKVEGAERIIAEHSEEWEQDPKGFFMITVNHEKGEIAVEQNDNDRKLLRIIVGKSAKALYKKIFKLGLVSLYPHAAYLGEELAKAEFALKNNLDYEQGKGLAIR